MGVLPTSQFLHLDQEDIDLLGKDVSNDKIKTALFDMAPLKAPGSDGFMQYSFKGSGTSLVMLFIIK